MREGTGDERVVLAYFEGAPGLEERLRASVSAIAGSRLRTIDVPAVDWLARFREGFRAFRAGGFLIAPCWDVPVDPAEPVLVVDPGQAFGTGTHESTRLCLRALATLVAGAPPPRAVLDVGAGSGILGIAAALRGAGRVTAVDIDEEALRCARAHAALNRAPLLLVRGDGAAAVRARSFDLVFANISAALLHDAREEIVRACAAAGTIVLSGFLAEDAGGLSRAYETAGAITRMDDGEWSALVVRVPRP